MIGMIRVPCISNDELDKALAASRRHAAFAGSATGDGSQVQDELRVIASRADHIVSHGLDELRPKRRHPVLWRMARRMAVVCIAVVAAGAVGAVVAVVASVHPGFGGSAQHSVGVAAAAMSFGPIIRFLFSTTAIDLLAKGIESLDRHVTGMRARRQRGDDRSDGFGTLGWKRGAG